MSNQNESAPLPWGIVLAALLPGLVELGLRLLHIFSPMTWLILSPDELVWAVGVVMAGAAMVVWRRRGDFPAWGLMAIGTAAVGLAPLLTTPIFLLAIQAPGGEEWIRELAARDIIANTAYSLSVGLVASAGAYGFTRYGRSSRPAAITWGVIALMLVATLLDNPLWRALMALYLLAAAGMGLIFSRRHGQRAALVLIGVVLAWMGILDIDYALSMYYDQQWVINLYGIVWRVLVFVIGPLWLLRTPPKRRVMWGAVLPVAAALAMETLFQALVKPYRLPHDWLGWLQLVPVAFLNPIALALAAALLLYGQDYRAGQGGPVEDAQPEPAPTALVGS